MMLTLRRPLLLSHLLLIVLMLLLLVGGIARFLHLGRWSHCDEIGTLLFDSRLGATISEARIAQAVDIALREGRSESTLRELVAAHTEGRALGVLGEPRVNVLLLNLALDRGD